MSDLLYREGFRQVSQNIVSWPGSTWRVSLVDTYVYAPSIDHVFFNAIPSTAVLATGTLPSPVEISNAFTSSDVTLTGAAAASMGHALVLYRWTGVAGSSVLVAFLDSTPGLPTAPDGNPLTLVWPHGPEKIFNRSGQFGQWSAVIQRLDTLTPGTPCSNPAGASRYFAY